jgi:hypothetical protein
LNDSLKDKEAEHMDMFGIYLLCWGLLLIHGELLLLGVFFVLFFLDKGCEVLIDKQ